MTDFAQDDARTSEELESFVEATVNEPLPIGLVEPGWLDLPELELDWLDVPTLEPNWLELPELEPDWLIGLDRGETELTHDGPEPEHDGDELDH